MIFKTFLIISIVYLYYLIFISSFYMCPYYKKVFKKRFRCKTCPTLKRMEETIHEEGPIHKDSIEIRYYNCEVCEKMVIIEFVKNKPQNVEEWLKDYAENFCNCDKEQHEY